MTSFLFDWGVFSLKFPQALSEFVGLRRFQIATPNGPRVPRLLHQRRQEQRQRLELQHHNQRNDQRDHEQSHAAKDLRHGHTLQQRVNKNFKRPFSLEPTISQCFRMVNSGFGE